MGLPKTAYFPLLSIIKGTSTVLPEKVMAMFAFLISAIGASSNPVTTSTASGGRSAA